ncbi:MAG: P-type conjugative transfer protein TrbJ [Legionella sp.]|uniref:P-type conjugative transfer protein TrbJ n=1 Tax=Legionella sp. TaxID=459 RepID=UPI0039E22845
MSLIGVGSLCHANMPVIDWANWYQNAQMLTTQANQYKNQLDQYNLMLANGKSLTSYQWDDANQIITNLVNTTNTLDEYKQQAGSLDAYLSRYQSEEYYSKGPCFNGNCSKEELKRLKQNQMNASVAQKKANDAMLRGIDRQQQQIKTDAARLKILQDHAQKAEGQQQAIQAASELASAQSNQLLQIRSLLITQQNAEATRAASLANKEAIQAAGDERFRSGTFRKSTGKSW